MSATPIWRIRPGVKVPMPPQAQPGFRPDTVVSWADDVKPLKIIKPSVSLRMVNGSTFEAVGSFDVFLKGAFPFLRP